MRNNDHFWLAEPLSDEPSFVTRPMFGCQACYLNGLLVLVFSDREQPWNGMLIVTNREHHDYLNQRYGSLVPHPILGKWLYLSAEDDHFESIARQIVAQIRSGDPRIGVLPSSQRRKRKARKEKTAKGQSRSARAKR